MTMNELMRIILKILPEAEFGEDNDGQIVIYTNRKTLVSPTGIEVLVDFED